MMNKLAKYGNNLLFEHNAEEKVKYEQKVKVRHCDENLRFSEQYLPILTPVKISITG